jgi:hypothetical protein
MLCLRISVVFDHLNPRRKIDRSLQDFPDERLGGARLSEERARSRSEHLDGEGPPERAPCHVHYPMLRVGRHDGDGELLHRRRKH